MGDKRENLLPMADFLYSDSATWSRDERLHFFYCISHMVGNIDKSDLYKRQLHALRIDKMGDEARVISLCAFRDVSKAIRFLNKESLKALLDTKIPSTPIVMSDRPMAVSPYKEMNVRF